MRSLSVCLTFCWPNGVKVVRSIVCCAAQIGKVSASSRLRQVARLAPLVEEGGYIGFCDHRVPPDVLLENYLYYLEQVRTIWGHGTNLRPMGQIVS